MPLGEIFTSPSAVRGAVATQNICCFSIQAIRKSGISVNICMMRAGKRRCGVEGEGGEFLTLNEEKVGL